MDVGPAELLIILAIVLLLFGSAKLPKLARSIGQASKEFKQGLSEDPAAPDSAVPVANDGIEPMVETPVSATGVATELLRLAELRDTGKLTEAEYDAAKSKLLA